MTSAHRTLFLVPSSPHANPTIPGLPILAFLDSRCFLYRVSVDTAILRSGSAAIHS